MDKSVSVGTRVGPVERALLDAAAARHGVSVSDWLRDRALEGLREEFGEQAVRPRRPADAPVRTG